MNQQLKNAAVELTFVEDGVLQVRNLRSGSERALRWPAFCLGLGDQVITSRNCTAGEPNASDGALRLSYRAEACDLEIVVTYSLWGGGFRKSLTVTGNGHPTPHRVYLDLQPVTPEEVTITGFEALAEAGEVADQEGEETLFGRMPGCGYPVYLGDWFVGAEHAAAFTVVAGGNLEVYHHPSWQDGGLATVPVVWGAATTPESVRAALDDYTAALRLPRLNSFLVSLCSFWSDPYVGGMEYDVSVEGYRRYLQSALDLGLTPDVLTLDAGWNDRRSILHFKRDADDAALQAFAEQVRGRGLNLSLWISRNGPMGFDPHWAGEQGYAVGKGLGAAYSGEEYLVMLDRHWERDLGDRLVELTGIIGATHFKIDWDNECASNARFAELYPTPDHVREETLNSWARIAERLRALNPRVVTRDGWWPSPWLLAHGSHLFLPASGDCEYAAWPARTQRDRSLNHRDAMYYKVFVADRSPVPLDAFDNHEFAQAPRNPVQEDRRTWLDNLVLTFTRGTSYITLFLNPEGLHGWQAEQLAQVLSWARGRARELLVRGARMVLGDPAAGEVYGFLHPLEAGGEAPGVAAVDDDEAAVAPGAWLVLRNPSVEPQTVHLDLPAWLGYTPASVWQVYPYWERVTGQRTLLGHEVLLLRAFREDPGELSPVPHEPFMVHRHDAEYQYLFPGNQPVSPGGAEGAGEFSIGPAVDPLMQLPELRAESPVEHNEPGLARRQWFVTVPHRMAEPELLVTLRGPQEALDGVSVDCSGSRYEGGSGEHFFSVERLGRKPNHGYGTRRFLPPAGSRERDDYVFRLPAGGRVSVTVEVRGAGAEELQWQAWLTGWEGPARQVMILDHPPLPGPVLPRHPHGFARSVKLL